MSLLGVLALVTQTAVAAQPQELRGEELMRALRAGGYTILLRHARTDRSVQEPMGTIPAARSAQRNLSAEGVRDAALMGAVLRKYRIPIGEIIASPMFRAVETAEAAAGTPTTSMALRVYPSTDEQAALVAAAPRPGTNRLLVTHHFVIEKHVPGIRPGEIAESEAAVIQPTGDGHVKLAGRILLGDWERLAGVPAATTMGGAAGSARPTAPGAAYPPAQAGDSTAIPNTAPGRLSRAFIAAINAADPVRIRQFVESSLVPNLDRPTDVRVQGLMRSALEYGPLTVLGVHASSANEISLAVRGKSGIFILTTKVSPDQPDRATSITLGTTGGGHP